MPDVTTMLRIPQFASLGDEAAAAEQLAEEASDFLRSHEWCKRIRAGYYADGYPPLLAVFYFEIQPAPGADEEVWVIVGDVPPAYIDTASAPDPSGALAVYVEAMEEWIECVRGGESLDDAVPVLVRGSLRPLDPTLDYADPLEARIELIRDEILTGMRAEPADFSSS